MSKGKSKIRIETTGEPPQTYNVDRDEEVTVKTSHEKPSVSFGGGGGGGMSGGDMLGAGCLAVIVCVVAIIFIVRGITYMMEKNSIKN